MFVKALRANSLANLMLIPILGIALWLIPFQFEEQAVLVADSLLPMPLYALVLKLTVLHSLIPFILGLLLLFTIAILLSRQNKDFLILNSRSYYLPLFFVAISSSYFPLLRLYPALIGSLFLLMALNRIFASYHDLKIGNYFFEAGLMLSIGSLFYFPLIFLALILWIGILLLRPIHFREWFMSVIGLLLPYLFTWSFYFLTDQNSLFFETMKANWKFDNSFEFLNLSNYLFYSFLLILTIPAGMKMIYQSGNRKVSTRKFLRVYFWLSVISGISLIVVPSVAIEMLPVLALSLSYLFANYFLHIKNTLIGNILLTVIILLMINLHLFPLYREFFRFF